MFSVLSKTEIVILAIFELWPADAINLDQIKILPFGIEFDLTLMMESVPERIENIVEKGENTCKQNHVKYW